MASEQIRVPSPGSGLVRYVEESKSKISFRPLWVIVMILVVLLLELYLHTYGSSIFGV